MGLRPKPHAALTGGTFDRACLSQDVLQPPVSLMTGEPVALSGERHCAPEVTGYPPGVIPGQNSGPNTSFRMRCSDERVEGDVVVLSLAVQGLGDLAAGVTERVRDLASDGHRRFVLNLDGLAGLDSHALGDLVASQQAAETVGARVALCNVHHYVSEPLAIMNVASLFDTFETVQDAVRGLS